MQDIDCQVDYWNRIGPTKPFHHSVNLERLSRQVPRTGRIVDYGCGYGRVLGELYAHGFRELLGVDAAPAMIDEARRRFPAVAFEHCQDPPGLNLPAASVDAVLLFTVLTCVPTDAGQRAIIGECRRVLKPGGLLYISDLWIQSDARNVARYERDRTKYGIYGVFDLPEGVTVRHHDPRWIETLTAAYDRVALDNLEVETMNGHRANAFQWFGLNRAREASDVQPPGS